MEGQDWDSGNFKKSGTSNNFSLYAQMYVCMYNPHVSPSDLYTYIILNNPTHSFKNCGKKKA